MNVFFFFFYKNKSKHLCYFSSGRLCFYGDGSIQLDLNMSRIKTFMVLFLVSLVALNQTTAEYGVFLV